MDVNYILYKSRLLNSSELKLIFILNDVLFMDESDVSVLLSIDRATFDFFVTTKDEILKKESSGFIQEEGLGAEIAQLAELFLELFNKVNVSASVSQAVKKGFIKKVIGLFIDFTESGFSNKHMIHAFVAYLYFNLSRQDTMFSSDRNLISLREQNRSKWDKNMIAKGLYHLDRSAEGSKVTIYHLESAIAAIHCLAKSYKETDWYRILTVYDKYLSVKQSPYVELQRASIISKINGAKSGIDEIMNIKQIDKLEDNPLLYSTLGNLHLQIHNYSTALENYEKAYEYSDIDADKKFYQQKVQICRQRLKMIENYHFYNSF